MSKGPLRPPDARVLRTLYRIGLGPLVGKLVLLLTTRGRKTGLARVTPLQYEEIDGAYVVASSNGTRADWYRNLIADPRVEVQVKSRRFTARTEPITDPERVADFLELRLQRHPRMVGRILRSVGLPARPTRQQLVDYASQLAMVVIRPIPGP